FIEERGRFRGIPIGAAIAAGEIIHSPYPRSALILRRGGESRIEILRLQGYVVRADGARYPVTAVNHPRGNDALVLYTARFGASTRTASGGVEAVLAPEALPLRFGEYRAATVLRLAAGAGDTAIPPEGLVISGQGRAGAFLKGMTPGEEIEFR